MRCKEFFFKWRGCVCNINFYKTVVNLEEEDHFSSYVIVIVDISYILRVSVSIIIINLCMRANLIACIFIFYFFKKNVVCIPKRKRYNRRN